MSEPVIVKKRFIAGAVCPQCHETDRLVVEIALQTSALPDEPRELSRRRCVACDFQDAFAADDRFGYQSLPRGRPERGPGALASTETVRIIDPSADGEESGL